jgi:hypothetical protein
VAKGKFDMPVGWLLMVNKSDTAVVTGGCVGSKYGESKAGSRVDFIGNLHFP